MLSSQRVARRGNWYRLALLGLLSLAGTAANAQSLNYGPPTVQNVAGTYTDLGTTGTAITTSSFDDANSSAQSIGFTFSFNGQSFSQFILNTNGFIKLGATAPSSAALFTAENAPDSGGPVNSPDANDNNLLLPFNFDLEAGSTGTEYRVATTGTAPNRVCTVQWKNVSDKAGTVAKQYANFSFQVKLYETTNAIEFVYGTATASTGTGNPHWATTGLKGSGSAQGQIVLGSKASVNAWSTTTFVDIPYDPTAFNALNFRNSMLPDPGRTFRFLPLYANDAEVQVVYTLAKLPLTSGAPHVVQAVVRNVGTAAQSLVPVTLRITGANTFSSTKAVTSLPVGGSATVTFDPFTPTALGNNTVTVSLLADDNSTNDSKAVAQEVNNTVFSYTSGNTSTGSVGITATNATGAFLAKYTTSNARSVTAVNAFLSNSTVAANNSIGRTVFGLVLNSSGVVVGRSADYVIQAGDINTYKTLTLTTPAAITAGSNFYAGLGVVNPTGSVVFYPASFQAETPTRPSTFYIIAPVNATGTNTLTDITSSGYGLLMVEAVMNTTTGVSKALLNAVNVYPNPSGGELTLDVRGANTKQGLQVEVSNLLGQRVYTSPVRDNFSNKLNLSNLANGLYTVKVSDGDQYMMRTITINK